MIVFNRRPSILQKRLGEEEKKFSIKNKTNMLILVIKSHLARIFSKFEAETFPPIDFQYITIHKASQILLEVV